MKISEQWLREWINPNLTRAELCERLTMAGLEIEATVPIAEKFTRVTVAQVLRVEKHPQADRLQVCEVDIGAATPLTIVCGAKNVIVGMKAALAVEGAVLTNQLKITASKLRGVLSQGMLCSAKELGLTQESEGLLVLPPNAPIGADVWEYLMLDDHVIDISITPNRGDCLSILGLAYEIAALTKTALQLPKNQPVSQQIKDTLPITVQATAECPRYLGRVIRNVNVTAITPIWLQERLRRAGVRCISPVVDVMNYVMLALGQPMHAFNLAKINGGIVVRMAQADEQLALLDGQTLKLDQATLTIADQEKLLAIAGVMGGLDSAVTTQTQDIFLESAFFQPLSIARVVRQTKLISESSYRFERGVDPLLQQQALEYATQLILEIAGGEAGPVSEITNQAALPASKKIFLRMARLHKLLGFTLAEQEVENILQRLGFEVVKQTAVFEVTVPARRFDVNVEIDLIEEVVRVYGYNAIPLQPVAAAMQMPAQSEKKLALTTIKHVLRDLGYQEVITYSFIDKQMQHLFEPDVVPKELLNPITTEMSVMRTSLWPGLVEVLRYNQHRQQSRIRIFEHGLRFLQQGESLLQQNMLSGLITGNAVPEQWGAPKRDSDFFDIKGDLQNLLRLTFAPQEFYFKAETHSALHPAQAAAIYRAGEYVGRLGVLHPKLAQNLGIQGQVMVFEILLDKLEIANLPCFAEISKFPAIRRDIAILVNQAVPVCAIQDTITEVAGELLQQVSVFDVYQGKGIAPQQKSIALTLTLQHFSRTLVDQEVASLMERIIGALKENFTAELRG